MSLIKPERRLRSRSPRKGKKPSSGIATRRVSPPDQLKSTRRRKHAGLKAEPENLLPSMKGHIVAISKDRQWITLEIVDQRTGKKIRTRERLDHKLRRGYASDLRLRTLPAGPLRGRFTIEQIRRAFENAE